MAEQQHPALDQPCATCGHPRRFHWLNTEQGERLGIFAEACSAAGCECVFFAPLRETRDRG